ncbi:DNA-dependent DNA helicase and ATPase [Piromyces finnis]|uniref:DNA helicase n=1 Tax=Piromyces finnis TaxID=1754191 RepID=A0A1Y1VE53_9FUNG|nr:DNA-dependent DNA helicase and ATPase [Piromyces finnis]|eukprot:ORX53904.1 DNA-dependent DNA helicase and ATPase [Piromyces finnis]
MPRGNPNFNPYGHAKKRFKGNFYNKRNAGEILDATVNDNDFVPLMTNSDDEDLPHNNNNNIIRNNNNNNSNNGNYINYNNYHDDDNEVYRGRHAYMNNPYHFWDTYFCDQEYRDDLEFIPAINKFINLFKNEYPDDISKETVKEAGFISVEFQYLAEVFNPEDSTEFQNLLKNQPEDLINCLGLSLSEVIYGNELNYTIKGIKPWPKLYVRIQNFEPITSLKNIKANYMNKFVTIKGTVVRISSVSPLATQMSFSCASCHSIQTIKFINGKYRMPTKCIVAGCKSKLFNPERGVKRGDTSTIDMQKLRIQESLSDDQFDSERIPRIIECEVVQDLIDYVIPGDIVTVTGTVKVQSSNEGRGKKGSMYILYIDVNSMKKSGKVTTDSVDKNDIGFEKEDIQFSAKDMYAIQDIHQQPNLFRLIVGSLCPGIFGHELVKAGLLLTLFGGSKKEYESKNKISMRSEPHILIVGDPGLGKSQMLRATVQVAPRGVYVCGNTATTSGLTVTVYKDGSTGGFALEAGALVLGDQGCCCIDEFDKMNEHQALLEAMEQCSVSVAKAGIVCTLPARTSVIAAANPVGGHYDKGKTVSDNLKMNPALLSRFDLIFILLDKPDKNMDAFLSEHVMKLHSGMVDKNEMNNLALNNNLLDQKEEEDNSLAERLRIKDFSEVDLIPPKLLRKYIAYAREYVEPVFTKEAKDVIRDFYLLLRSKYRSIDNTPITTRQLESMTRLAEARAKAELRLKVTAEDAQDVVEIMKYSLFETSSDEYGNLDFSRSQLGTGMSKKNQPKKYIQQLEKIAEMNRNNLFTFQQLSDLGKKMGVEGNFNDFIDTLNTQGYLIKNGAKVYKLTTSSY